MNKVNFKGKEYEYISTGKTSPVGKGADINGNIADGSRNKYALYNGDNKVYAAVPIGNNQVSIIENGKAIGKADLNNDNLSI